MALRSVKGVGQRTTRDEARRTERDRLAYEWARVDAMMNDVLGDDDTISPSPSSDIEVS